MTEEMREAIRTLGDAEPERAAERRVVDGESAGALHEDGAQEQPAISEACRQGFHLTTFGQPFVCVECKTCLACDEAHDREEAHTFKES
jgi:hypothetical protein